MTPEEQCNGSQERKTEEQQTEEQETEEQETEELEIEEQETEEQEPKSKRPKTFGCKRESDRHLDTETSREQERLVAKKIA